MEGMTTLHSTHDLQAAQTQSRLFASRLLGLGVLAVVLSSASYWDNSDRALVAEVLFLLGVVLTVAGVCGRLWCLVYIGGRKKRELVTAGPYALCRHPLYLSTLACGVGLGLCTETLSASVIFVVAFLVYYPYNIHKEERFLVLNFAGYEEYQRRVPRFFPTWPWRRGAASGCEIVVDGRAFAREILTAAGLLLVPGIFEFIESLHESGTLPTYFLLP
jgi:protein-S-isoprenylcysteine O-methyltransferase Ste14